MRIGLSGRTTQRDKIIEQARQAEADGFASLWYPGGGGGDPLSAIGHAGGVTSRIGVGTAVLATYLCHPVILAARAVAAAEGLAPDRFTLGIGPSHRPAMEAMYGVPYTRPGQHTAEYLSVLQSQLRGEAVDMDGEVITVHVPKAIASVAPVRVLIGALGPKLLEIAGAHADGTVLWMANARAISDHVRPTISRAAEYHGRPAPAIVAGLPVAVHDDEEEARTVAARQFAVYGSLPNYQRILAAGGIVSPAEAVIVGNEEAVRAQLETLLDAGATEIWADVFTVGADRSASRQRTMALLRDLAG